MAKNSNNTKGRRDNKNGRTYSPLTSDIMPIPGVAKMNEAALIKAIKIDGKKVSQNITGYLRDNITLYDFAITSWMCLIADYIRSSTYINTARLTTLMCRCITENGLFYVIDQAVSMSEKLIDCSCDLTVFRCIALPNDPFGDHSTWSVLLDVVTECKSAREALQFLRYLKRFSPVGTDLLDQEVWEKFSSVERKCGWANRHIFDVKNAITNSTYLSDRHADTLSQRIDESFGIIKGMDYRTRTVRFICDRAAHYVHDILKDFSLEEGYFSNGAISDGKKAPVAKVVAAYSKGIHFVNTVTSDQVFSSLVPCTKDVENCCQWLTVAKSYKTRRPIAVEECARSYRMQRYRLGLRACLSQAGVDLDDQSINQRYARKGSITRKIASVDLTAASDHNSYGLTKDLFRYDRGLFYEMDRLRAKYLVKDGKKYQLEKFATSGSPLCFEIETIVFYALTLATRDLVAIWLPDDQELENAEINTYGDDIIAPSVIVPTLIDVFEMLGLEINPLKTHWSEKDPYRESCGEEYAGGEDLSSAYFPRKTMVFRGNTAVTVQDEPETIASLISMQHRLVSYPITSDYIENVIRRFIPDMTESFIDSPYTDIWKTIPHISYRRKTVNDGEPDDVTIYPYHRIPEVHYVLVTSYERSTDQRDLALANALGLHYSLTDNRPSIEKERVNIASLCDIGTLLWKKKTF